MFQAMLKFLQVFFGHPMFDFSLFSNTLQLLLFCLLLFIASVPFPSPSTVLMYSHFFICLSYFFFFFNLFFFCRFVLSLGENVEFPTLIYIFSLKALVFKSQLRV
jgi:hypothetical protein